MAANLDQDKLRSLIEEYFHQGHENKVILDFLKRQHGIVISLATLKRRLQDYDLRRRVVNIDENRLKDIIQQEMSGPGELGGYRAIWHSLRLNHHVHVPRGRVADLVRELNPEASQQRRSRRLARRRYTSHGPNFCWHVDGYDKLKPYGFPIHGAIDGYSRKIIWLEVSRSNNNPEIIARFFLDCVKENSGCPVLLRTDCGTENGTMAACQVFFRQHDCDQFAGEKSHKYGSSPSNQRIECWWSILRRGRSSWWIDLFKGMVQHGEVDLGSELHTECLWFCFNGVLQEDLDNFKHHWNTHRIRPSRYGTVPGVPDVLYFLPQRSGSNDCKIHVASEQVHEMELHIDEQTNCEHELNLYQEYFHYVMGNEIFQNPGNTDEAYSLFQRLIDIAST